MNCSITTLRAALHRETKIFQSELTSQAEWWRSCLVEWVLSEHATWMTSPPGKQVMGIRSSLGSIWSIFASWNIWNSAMQKQKNDEFSLLILCRAGEQSIVVEYIYLPLQSQFLWGKNRDKDSCILQEPAWYLAPIVSASVVCFAWGVFNYLTKWK